jgi:hypothetical protein
VRDLVLAFQQLAGEHDLVAEGSSLIAQIDEAP